VYILGFEKNGEYKETKKNTDIQLSIILPNPDPILETWGSKLVCAMTPCLKFWAQGVEFEYIFGVRYFTKSITQVTTQLSKCAISQLSKG